MQLKVQNKFTDKEVYLQVTFPASHNSLILLPKFNLTLNIKNVTQKMNGHFFIIL